MSSTDAPLFGDQKKSSIKWVIWAVIGIMGVLIIFSSAVGIIFGILHKTPQHIILVGAMLLLVALMLLVVRLLATHL